MPSKKVVSSIAMLVLFLIVINALAVLFFSDRPVCGNGVLEQGETSQTCCLDAGCIGQQGCAENVCINPVCGACQFSWNGTCLDYECCTNAQCTGLQACESNKCLAVTCGYCKYVSNHQCLNLPCCADEDCDDADSSTLDKCSSPSSVNAYCSNTPLNECETSRDCDDDDDSTRDRCTGTPRKCVNREITACDSGDDFCPSGCSYSEDNDCPQQQASQGAGLTSDTSYNVPVLVVSYIPVTGSGDVDTSKTGDWQNPSLGALRSRISQLNGLLVSSLTAGSKYHGYKDASAAPSLTYSIKDQKEFLKPVPKSAQFPPFGDHFKMLQGEGFDVCDYVENQGVKEVWVWMYHTAEVEPIESNMAGPFGDISNSYRQPDLPVCAKTYTVYDYNYGRGLGEALEDHGHQIEAVMRYVDDELFWNKWAGNPSTCGQQSFYRCGWIHSPPNNYATCPVSEYEWYGENLASSDCEDWKPDGSGEKNQVSCKTWESAFINPDRYLLPGKQCYVDGGTGFKVWWMQNLPGRNNNLVYNGKQLRNWWDFFGDFDKAMASPALTLE